MLLSEVGIWEEGRIVEGSRWDGRVGEGWGGLGKGGEGLVCLDVKVCRACASISRQSNASYLHDGQHTQVLAGVERAHVLTKEEREGVRG